MAWGRVSIFFKNLNFWNFLITSAFLFSVLEVVAHNITVIKQFSPLNLCVLSGVSFQNIPILYVLKILPGEYPSLSDGQGYYSWNLSCATMHMKVLSKSCRNISRIAAYWSVTVFSKVPHSPLILSNSIAPFLSAFETI